MKIIKNGTAVKNAANAGDLSSVSRLGRASGEGNDNPLQYSCLGNPKEREAWWATELDMTSWLNNN